MPNHLTERFQATNKQTLLSIKLKAPDETIFELFFPDLSGETFQKHYVQRSISEELADYIQTADAVLFFIHVDSVKSIGLISEHMTCIQDNKAEPSLARDPKKHDPLQVQVIELLQFISDLRKGQLTKISFVFFCMGYSNPSEFRNDTCNLFINSYEYAMAVLLLKSRYYRL